MNKLIFSRMADVDRADARYDWWVEPNSARCVEHSFEYICGLGNQAGENSEGEWSHIFRFRQDAKIWRFVLMGTSKEIPLLNALRGQEIVGMTSFMKRTDISRLCLLFVKTLTAGVLSFELDPNTTFYLEELVDDIHA